jgi:hypothetical protein
VTLLTNLFIDNVSDPSQAVANATPGDFSATIDWGTGQTLSGTITAVDNSGDYQVAGSNTYFRGRRIPD